MKNSMVGISYTDYTKIIKLEMVKAASRFYPDILDQMTQPPTAVLHNTILMPKYGPRQSVFKQWLNKWLLIANTAASEEKWLENICVCVCDHLQYKLIMLNFEWLYFIKNWYKFMKSWNCCIVTCYVKYSCVCLYIFAQYILKFPKPFGCKRMATFISCFISYQNRKTCFLCFFVLNRMYLHIT